VTAADRSSRIRAPRTPPGVRLIEAPHKVEVTVRPTAALD
jgi:hypothetical protein